LSTLVAISDGEDTVVKLGSASRGEDSTSVHLESHLVSLNSDGDWAMGETSLHLGVLLLEVVEGGDGSDSGSLRVSTGSN